MKRQFLLTRMLLLFALIVGSGSTWATEYSYTFTSTVFSSNGTQSLGSVSWTLAGNGGFWGYDGTKGQQFGSGTKPYKSLTLTGSISGTITSIVVNASGANDITGSISCTVGGSNFGTQNQTLTSSAKNFTFSGNASGAIVISMSQSSSKALYIKSITVTYSIGSGPSITVTPLSRTVSYDSEGGTFTVSLNKIDTSTGTEVLFYESNGTTPATYDWIYANIDGDGNVSYVLTENTDPINSRTAYFKVYGLDDANADDVYSDLVSITQNKYTVDYATLPFEFSGGKSDIASTNGLTHSGLGSDYSSSPLLKFDDTNDKLILKVKGSLPKQLSFDIAGKTFSGGTFKVQWSANGTDYTDLKTYSSSIKDGNEKIDLTSCTGLKYIKWIYTSKSGGNVALGNINVTPQTTAVTISSAKYATLCSDKALDFSGTDITAYTATDGATKVTLNEIASGKVPANTPVVLHNADADGTPIDVPVIASADAVGDNDLAVVTDEEGKVGVANMFVLSKPAEKEVGFYAWEVDVTLNKGKVYLQGKAFYGSRSFLGFDDETTGIEAVDVNTESANVAREYYNLNGQRVANPSKGLYIVNGRKVIIK